MIDPQYFLFEVYGIHDYSLRVSANSRILGRVIDKYGYLYSLVTTEECLI